MAKLGRWLSVLLGQSHLSLDAGEGQASFKVQQSAEEEESVWREEMATRNTGSGWHAIREGRLAAWPAIPPHTERVRQEDGPKKRHSTGCKG